MGQHVVRSTGCEPPRQPLAFEIAIQAAILWAAVSVLVCLLVWKLPRTYPVGVIQG